MQALPLWAAWSPLVFFVLRSKSDPAPLGLWEKQCNPALSRSLCSSGRRLWDKQQQWGKQQLSVLLVLPSGIMQGREVPLLGGEHRSGC